MTIETPGVPPKQIIEDLRAAATHQATHQWAPVHYVDHKTRRIGIYGALRLAVYGIASLGDDPTFVPTDDQRARIWAASKALNDHVNDQHGMTFVFDWNSRICRNTDDAVNLFLQTADGLMSRAAN